MKRIIRTTRNKLFSSIMKPLREIERKVSIIEEKQEIIATQQVDFYNKFSSQIKAQGSTILRTSDKEIVVKVFSGVKMVLDPKDISVTPHLALDGVWEHDITGAWLNVLKASNTVLDIGANFGYFGLLAAQQTHSSKSKTVFFEANPELIPYIDKSLSINNYLEYSSVENVAVSDKEGTLKLNTLKDYIGSSSVHSIEHLNEYVGKKIHLKPDKVVEVKATTIDLYCKKNDIKTVDLVKMDIEGYEDSAYKGMRETVKKSPNITLFIEFTKYSYNNPEMFYKQLLSDFGNVYTIRRDGSLLNQKKISYTDLSSKVDDWIMLVFSKKANL